MTPKHGKDAQPYLGKRNANQNYAKVPFFINTRELAKMHNFEHTFSW